MAAMTPVEMGAVIRACFPTNSSKKQTTHPRNSPNLILLCSSDWYSVLHVTYYLNKYVECAKEKHIHMYIYIYI